MHANIATQYSAVTDEAGSTVPSPIRSLGRNRGETGSGGRKLLENMRMLRKLLVLGHDSTGVRRYCCDMGERRGRRLRGAGVLAGVTLAALALGGCSLIGDGQTVWGILQEEAETQARLSAAVSELRELPGVEEATSRFLPDGPQGDEADISVVANTGATTPQLRAIASVVRDAFADADLVRATPLFTLQLGEGSTLTQRGFALTEEQLAAEITYWREAEDAIRAPISLNLVEVDAEPSYRLEYFPTENSDAMRATEQFVANYGELLAILRPADVDTWWLLPGLMTSPDLPPVEVIDLLDRIRESSPLIDYTAVNDEGVAPEGAAVWWHGEGQGARVIVNAHELRASDWPMVLELARLAITVPGASFGYDAVGGEQYAGYHFFTADCGGEVSVEPNDRVLVEALVDGGTVLPAGGPGFCQPPPPKL